MIFLHIAKYVLILFAGGLATSYAEYKFQYSLYDTIKDKLLPPKKAS
jgi:hypothetical protein